jgi:hypothetical protein
MLETLRAVRRTSYFFHKQVICFRTPRGQTILTLMFAEFYTFLILSLE